MTREILERRQTAARPASLLRLVFVSTASRTLAAPELDALERACQRRNEASGIVGLLFAQGSHYFGVLEGPEPLLLRRMELIATDPRHHGLRILREQNLDTRRFVGWRLFRLPPSHGTPASNFIFDFARRLA